MVNTLNRLRLKEMLESYKHDFTLQHWEDERYKWIAIKHFQEHWNPFAEDFPNMLKFSLSKTKNLLARINHYPARMIVNFARAEPETVRNMFRNLFDPEREIYDRISEFKELSGSLLEKYADSGKQHYQNENAISTYLWLQHPESYYIYKFNEGMTVAQALESGQKFVKGDYANNVRNFYALYDEMREIVATDRELTSLYRGYLSDAFYPDKELRVLTADVGFYINRRITEARRPLKMKGRTFSSKTVPDSETNVDSRKTPEKTGRKPQRKKDRPAENCGHWWLNANPKIWRLSDWTVGATQAYTLYSDGGHKRRIFQNFLDARAGDLVIGYESTPVKQIVALAKVCAEQNGEDIFFEKVEGLSAPIEYSALKDCPELAGMEFFRNPQGSLFKLTAEEYDFILGVIREENPIHPAVPSDSYSAEDFLCDVYMARERFLELTEVLKAKKNIILQGAPGVGKTFAAKRLAWAMMGEKDENRIQFVQFHQNYSYEDFVMGYKPAEEGFELKYGIFYQFCQKAANQPGQDFFFIIDEINRGNMSKIFGELLMLIERNYRDTKVTMSYNGLPFSVPKNLYIIGMMNTADRSLAMIDYALRRRFSFFDMQPGFDSDGFIQYQQTLGSDQLNALIARVKELNQEILRDRLLGKGFQIGHSYFCGCEECTLSWLRAVIDHDILPMLSEYWFDDPDKVLRWEQVLHGVVQ